MLERQAAAQPGKRDVWYDGRFLAEWANQKALAELPTTFAAYEIGDLTHALLTTLNLFRQPAEELASQLNMVYSVETDQVIDQYLRDILRHRNDR